MASEWDEIDAAALTYEELDELFVGGSKLVTDAEAQEIARDTKLAVQQAAKEAEVITGMSLAEFVEIHNKR